MTKIDGHMMSQVKAVNGQIGWLGGNGRPDLAAAHSIIAGGCKNESFELITLCNACVKSAQAFTVALRIWPIPIADIRFVACCDSSFVFRENATSRDGL